MRAAASLLLIMSLAWPAGAGKLDLDLYGEVRAPAAARPRPQAASTPITWKPGDPRDLASAPKPVQALAATYYAGLGVAGAVACAAALPAAAAGFAFVAAVSLYRLYKTFPPRG